MILDEIKILLQKEAEAVGQIPVTAEFEKALNIIHEQVHIKNGKLITSGMGKAGQIGVNMATTFINQHCLSCPAHHLRNALPQVRR